MLAAALGGMLPAPYWMSYNEYYHAFGTVAMAGLNVSLRRYMHWDMYALENRGSWTLAAVGLVLRVLLTCAAALATVAATLSPTLRAKHAAWFKQARAAAGLPDPD